MPMVADLIRDAKKRYGTNMASSAESYLAVLLAVAEKNKPPEAPGHVINERDGWWALYNIASLIEMLLPAIAQGGPDDIPELLWGWRLLRQAVVKVTGKTVEQIDAEIGKALMCNHQNSLIPHVRLFMLNEKFDAGLAPDPKARIIRADKGFVQEEGK